MLCCWLFLLTFLAVGFFSLLFLLIYLASTNNHTESSNSLQQSQIVFSFVFFVRKNFSFCFVCSFTRCLFGLSHNNGSEELMWATTIPKWKIETKGRKFSNANKIKSFDFLFDWRTDTDTLTHSGRHLWPKWFDVTDAQLNCRMDGIQNKCCVCFGTT